MKKILLSFFLLCGVELHVYAQQQYYPAENERSLVQRVTKLENKSNRLKVFLNLQGGFDSQWSSPASNNRYNHFNVRQLRMEAKGNINERFSFHWRQQLNRPNTPGMDNLPSSIDMASIGVKLNDQWSLLLGKQAAAYGGIEYDMNPIEIYEFSDMNWYVPACFMTGANLRYQITPDHQLQMQVLNGLNHGFNSVFSVGYDASIEPSKLPLMYALNWNGNLFDNLLQTRWSASLFSESNKHKQLYFAAGNQINFSREFNMFVDLMYSRDELDSRGVVSGLVQKTFNHADFYSIPNVDYFSVVAKANFRFLPRWNWFVKGMYETASVSKASTLKGSEIATGKYSTSLGYYTGLEYYPMQHSNMHFFLTYIGRSHKYDAKVHHVSNYDTNRISLGIIYQIPVF